MKLTGPPSWEGLGEPVNAVLVWTKSGDGLSGAVTLPPNEEHPINLVNIPTSNSKTNGVTSRYASLISVHSSFPLPFI